MKITLHHRHHGVHSPIKHEEIPVNLEEVYHGEDHINEDLIIERLPKTFLPVLPQKCLLTVAYYDDYGNHAGGTGQRGLNQFRNWAKYFDAYVLELQR